MNLKWEIPESRHLLVNVNQINEIKTTLEMTK